jgi:hypothetical protein
MLARGYTQEYANRIFKQIEGSANMVSRIAPASFALLAYASAWLKCHAPVEFTAALLNSQPMGFYQPAQLVRDARDMASRCGRWMCHAAIGTPRWRRANGLRPATLRPTASGVGIANARNVCAGTANLCIYRCRIWRYVHN